MFFHTGGEAASHIGIYLPAPAHCVCRRRGSGADLPAAPFAARHAAARHRTLVHRDRPDARLSTRSIWCPATAQIVAGADKIQTILTNYRDAMQYVLDQSVRLINMGYTPDEIAETVKLPEAVQVEPWGIEYYGNVDVSARNVYGGYISWWNGDPAELGPTPRLENARRTVEMMGGRDKVFAEAERAFFAGDPQWAAELTTPLIRIDSNDWARALSEGGGAPRDRLQADQQQPARLLPHRRAGDRRQGRSRRAAAKDRRATLLGQRHPERDSAQHAALPRSTRTSVGQAADGSAIVSPTRAKTSR